MSYSQFRLDGAILQALKKNKEESPNPTQKQILKTMTKGGDLLVSAPLKENADRAALLFSLNQIVKESSWTGTKILYLTSDQKRVEKADKWCSAFPPALEQLTIEAFDSPDVEGAESANLNKISKGSTLLITTPEAILPLLEKQDIIFRGLKTLIIENGTKFSDDSLIERLMPRLMGDVQTIVQLSRPSEATLAKYKELLGDPELIEAKAEITSTKKKSKAESKDSGAGQTSENTVAEAPVPEQETEKSDSPHVTRSTLGAKKSDSYQSKKSDLAQSKKSDSAKAKKADPAEVQKVDLEKFNETPSESKEAAPKEPQELEPISIAEVMESLKGVTFKTLTIPDQTQIEAFVKVFEPEKEKKTLGYVIGSFEADTLFKQLRNQEVRLVSVHSKLRRNTYEYRLSRFYTGELSLAIIGGNLKTSDHPEGVEKVIFSNPPKSSEQFFRKLSRIGFSDQNPEVLVLVQQSQESEFLKWAVQTELKFTPLDATPYQDLKPSGRAPKEQRDKGSKSGGREQKQQQQATASNGVDSAKSQSSKGVREDSRRSDDRSKGKGQKRPDRNRDHRGKSSRGKPYQEGQPRGENRGQSGRDDRGSSGRDHRQDKGRPQQRREEPKKSTPYGLPAASYDRLERGRSGKKESKGLFGAIKKLFGGD